MTPVTCNDNIILVRVLVAGKYFNALIDTGATRSFCSRKVAEQCENEGIKGKTVQHGTVIIANGQTAKTPKLYEVSMKIADFDLLDLKFLLVSNLPVEIILGMDVLTSYDFSINLKTAECFLEGQLISVPKPTEENTGTVYTIEEHLLDLTDSEKSTLETFLTEELRKFDHLQGTTTLIEHKIRLKPDTVPIKQRYRPQNPKIQEIFNQEVDQMLTEGVIEPSTSPWSSPVVQSIRYRLKMRIHYRISQEFSTNYVRQSTFPPLI